MASKDPGEPETQDGSLSKDTHLARPPGLLLLPAAPLDHHAESFRKPATSFSLGHEGSKTSLRYVLRLRSLFRVLVGFSVALRPKGMPAAPALPTSMALRATDSTLADALPRESGSR